MTTIRPFCQCRSGEKARVALFLSGSGTNAEAVLEYSRCPSAKFRIALLVTDAPETSAANALAERFGVPVASLDIRTFYAERGETSIRLDSERRRELRNEWSEALWHLVEPFQPDFAVLAGFVPLTNITGKLSCLNVHPGDLTVEENGRRIFAGLHYLPVERAILRGNRALRSSVILAQCYSGGGDKEMDSGPVLGVSAPVPVDLESFSVEALRGISDGRGAPPHEDELRRIARKNIEMLKVSGDHVVLPAAVDLFAAGRYGSDGKQWFFLDDSGAWIQVKSIEFSPDGTHRPMSSSTAVPVAAKKKRGRIFRYLKWLYTKVVRGNGPPEYIARGWALGMCVGCVIPVFCQLIVAVPLAFVVRGSKIGAALGTFITTPPTAVFIYPIQVWIGNRVLGGTLSMAAVRRDTLKLVENGDYHSFIAMGRQIIAAFFAGGILWAAVMTPLTYFGVKYLVNRYRKFRTQRMAAAKIRGGAGE